MIVWLASYPRSGNTLLRLLLNHYHGIGSYDYHRSVITHDPGFERVRELRGSIDWTRSIDEMRADSIRHFVKTHDLPPDDAPALYVVRDPRDVFVSQAWFTAPAEVPMRPHAPIPEPVLRKLIDQSAHGWSDHVAAWTRRQGPTAVLHFEDLLREPRPLLREALRNIGVAAANIPAREPPPFSELHALNARFFRRGEVGSWREEMTDEIAALVWRCHGEMMRATGYVL